MCKAFKLLLAVLQLLSLPFYASSQFFVKTNADSIAMDTDSVVLTIGEVQGKVKWMVSKDSLSWEDPEISGDTMRLKIDSTAYYRAVLTVDNCDPVYSEISMAGFKSGDVSGKYFEVDSTGGVFFFPTGIKMIVPAGAVNENSFIACDILDEEQADLRMPFAPDSGKSFGTALTFEPSGMEFLKPVKIKIPLEDYQYTDLPGVYLYHFLTGSWEKFPGQIVCSVREKYVEFSLDRALSARIMITKDVFANLWPGKKTAKEDSCKEDIIKVVTESAYLQNQYKGTYCYMAKDKVNVKFVKCPGQPEATASIREIGEDCQPVVKGTIGKKCLKKGESTNYTITATIQGDPLIHNYVAISQPVGLSMSPANGYTDENGSITFRVTAIEDFEGSFYCVVACEYYLLEIDAKAEGLQEHLAKGKVTKSIKLTQNLSCAVPQLTSISVSGYKSYLSRNESTQIAVKCYDQFGDILKGPLINYIIVNSFPAGVIQIDEFNKISATGPGVAEVIVKAEYNGMTIESNPIYFHVPFYGTLILNKYLDHEVENATVKCGCKEEFEKTLKWSYYKVFYDGSLELMVWLNSDPSLPPSGKLVGQNIIQYQIESDYCKDTLIFENVASYELICSASTQEILSGNTFTLIFNYFDYRGNRFPNFLPLECKLNGSVIEAMVSSDYSPEACIGKGKIDEITILK